MLDFGSYSEVDDWKGLSVNMLGESHNRCLQLGRSIARGSACSDSGSGDLSFMGESIPAGKGMFAARVTSSSISCAS